MTGLISLPFSLPGFGADVAEELAWGVGLFVFWNAPLSFVTNKMLKASSGHKDFFFITKALSW